jgi:hypothetical protein
MIKDRIEVEFTLNELVVAAQAMRMTLDDNDADPRMGVEDCMVAERVVARLVRSSRALGEIMQGGTSKS